MRQNPGGSRSGDVEDTASTQTRNGGVGSVVSASISSTDEGQSPRSPITSSNQRPSWLDTFSSLSNRNYLFLWLGMIFLMSGTQMQMLTRGYLIYDLTGSASVLGYVNLGIAVPMLTIPLFSGVIADRFERKTIIQVAQVVAVIQVLVVGFLIDRELVRWQHLMVASMVQGGLWAFMMPARQAIIPQLVGPEKITNAMALNAAGISATTMVAPAIAGGLYSFVGPWNVYYVIGALMFCSVVLTFWVPKTGSSTQNAGASVFRDMADGVIYIARSRILLILLLTGLAATMLAMPFRFILPVFVVDVYKQGPESMGLLVGLMGLGSMAGALYVAAAGKGRRGITLIITSLMSGFGLLLVAALPFYSAATMIMIILGIGDSGRQALNQTLIVEEAEEQFRGRVMSVFMLNFGLMPLSILPAGILTDYLGGQVVVAFMGTALIAIFVFVAITQRPLRVLK